MMQKKRKGRLDPWLAMLASAPDASAFADARLASLGAPMPTADAYGQHLGGQAPLAPQQRAMPLIDTVPEQTAAEAMSLAPPGEQWQRMVLAQQERRDREDAERADERDKRGNRAAMLAMIASQLPALGGSIGRLIGRR